MAKLSDRILGERLSGFVTKPNILDNSNFQIRQRGNNDGGSGAGGTYIDRWDTRSVTGSGGTTTISVPTLNSGGIGYDVLSVNVAGHTSYWTIQQFFKVERLKSGSDYTFTFKTNLIDNPLKLKAKMRGRDVSAGDWADLGEVDIEVDSYGTYSVTFLNVTSSLPLNADADYIAMQLTGFQSDGGSDFVLPDGTYRFEWFKLEEGNTSTGYEPTPYAVDELECMKWYQEVAGRWTGYPQFNSSTNFSRAADVNFPVLMYSTPAVTVNASSAWSPTLNVYKSMVRASGTPLSGSNGTWVDSYTASCEL